MLKVITIYLFPVLFFISFKYELINGRTAKKPAKDMDCNTTYDCFDFRMICSKNTKICGCANFHDWDRDTKRCIANISKIFQWLRATMSTESEAVSHPEDFKRIEGSTILKTKWAEYEGVKETGLGHVTRVIWPILLGSAVILIVYGAILLEFL